MAKKNTAANIIIALIVIVFLVVVIGLVSIDGILRSAIQTAIKKQLNVGASVSKVSLKIMSGTLEITNLKINNPKGYQFANILEAKTIFVKTSLGDLLNDPVKIEQINVDGILMILEQKGLSNNLNDLLKGMPEKEEKPAEPEKEGKSVHIASLDINDISVTAKLLPVPGKGDAVTLTIPSLHLSDLGGEKQPLAKVIGEIITEIANAVATQGQGIIPSDMIGPIQDAIQGQLGKITGEGQKIIEEAGKDIQEKATEKLKGIFKPKAE